ncbi:hypothetical protein KIPE111705_43635 [Kibdelosporangium persicum]|uniref:hypothetical protein n=1 Tax=Kibdelosporangium persicum TaxID=2698649 RepID=UPI001FE4D1EC|nr:hypothetical protein [Kibdelosporangium persicum]
MVTREHSSALQSPTDAITIVRSVTVIMGTVVGLTFLFGFGNVLNLALRLGVPVWVAPLVAPAVDLSILGLLLGIRHLALTGACPDVLRPARRLLIFASVVALALNVADPLIACEYGNAAFDAVGPLLLIGWAEVGPGFLQAIAAAKSSMKDVGAAVGADQIIPIEPEAPESSSERSPAEQHEFSVQERQRRSGKNSPETLLAKARQEDAAHRARHQRPISAETLRVRLGIGAVSARQLVRIVRSEFEGAVAETPICEDPGQQTPRGETEIVA